MHKDTHCQRIRFSRHKRDEMFSQLEQHDMRRQEGQNFLELGKCFHLSR